jgi:hypothetical protein
MPMPSMDVQELIREVGNLHLQVVHKDKYIAQLESDVLRLTNDLARMHNEGKANGSGLLDAQENIAAARA